MLNSARLKEIRVSKGLTQSKLAEITGVVQSTIAQLENGDIQPALSTLERLAKALDVNLTLLLLEEVNTA